MMDVCKLFNVNRMSGCPRQGEMYLLVKLLVVVIVLVVEVEGKCKLLDAPKIREGEMVLGHFEPANFSSVFDCGKCGNHHHHHLSHDHRFLSLKFDNASSLSPKGIGFKSKHSYLHGFFNIALKLSSKAYTAGIVTTFYLSNVDIYQNNLTNEVKFEYLGRATGEEYILQTSLYTNMSTNVGREQRFRPWFDASSDFHNYSLAWTHEHIVFFIDNVPIREFQRMKHNSNEYLTKPMYIYARIFDGSDWATNGGKNKANYIYAPFVVEFSNFILNGCRTPLINVDKDIHCDNEFNLLPQKLTHHQHKIIDWAQQNFMTYNYCNDVQRHPNNLPDCFKQPNEENEL